MNLKSQTEKEKIIDDYLRLCFNQSFPSHPITITNQSSRNNFNINFSNIFRRPLSFDKIPSYICGTCQYFLAKYDVTHPKVEIQPIQIVNSQRHKVRGVKFNKSHYCNLKLYIIL